VWQALRGELYSQGLEIVTVALDTDADAARRNIERAQPDHPSLIDQAHVVDALFGIVNVPSGVWIDEDGMIVRPPEPAWAQRRPPREIPANATPRQVAAMTEARKIRYEPEKYVAALRDWVARGRASCFALSPDDVVRRSRPRPIEESTAAAHFELGQHFYRNGRIDDAVRHFREAHRLQPDNWTYRRQAWSLADPTQGPTNLYESDWLTDVLKTGAENYYPPLDM
jgi:tetratricopeptide (TPR) repeat protein